ncbi:magnesium transporter CorA [Aquabacterium soli]|uniref:Magnesium transporter CorA n=1 Tax=Aquabacterium soli TaxID=2493092 RepID=A0A3R8S329_9BURK|nr:magnesium transporter CorA family protein [Aquabacterium soli]RRS04915.1 magnesium transporter CorA [Aquabacterium soli]
MRFFLINDRFQELPGWPDKPPADGFLWVTLGRREFEVNLVDVQTHLQQLAGGALVDLHVADLLNPQLPSQFDYTSWYDLMVFRRLAAGPRTERMFLDESTGTASSARQALASIDTSPMGLAVFERLLLTVHPADCAVYEFFVNRMLQMTQGRESSPDQRGSASRLPPSPADLMLRIVNHMVDSYLDLRRLLTRQFGYLQQELLGSRSSRFINWHALLESRNALHLLEDTCEDQRSAIQEWIDALDEWPVPPDPVAAREREVLRVRSRDVHEHIERVLTHVRRLESSAESAVQMHFSAQGSRTNEIMRTLTVLTAIFLPLNLITGIFGMNFDSIPLIHKAAGFWIACMLMAGVAVSLAWLFWRKRYLSGD